MIKILDFVSDPVDKINQISGLLKNKIYTHIIVPYYYRISIPNNQTITIPAWTDIYTLKTGPDSQYQNSELKLINNSIVFQRTNLNAAEAEKMLKNFTN